MPSIFGVPVGAAYHLVSGFTSILTPVLGGLAAVTAIIAITVAVRIVLMPLSFRALRGQAAAARLAPQLQNLRHRYARQPERLQREMAALYKREGTSMFASITPFLLQWPLLSVMYLLFRSAQVGGKPNTLLAHHLLGVPLGSHWLGGAGLVSGPGLVFLGLFALLAGLVWLSVRLGQRMTAQATAVTAAPEKPAKVTSGAAARPASGAAATTASTAAATTASRAAAQAAPVPGGALVKLLPYLTVVIAAFAPLAAGIYLLVSTGWALVERRLYLRFKAGGQEQEPLNPTHRVPSSGSSRT
jgi:YidC/Oxa1 family membrane protein insertase